MAPIQNIPKPVEYTVPVRESLARTITKLFERWQLDSAQSLALLGLAEGNRAALKNYRDGKPIGNSRDTLDRVGNLLALHKNLRLLFPRNAELCYAWMTTPNKAFDGMTPVECIQAIGFPGLLMVRAYLDRARGQ